MSPRLPGRTTTPRAGNGATYLALLVSLAVVVGLLGLVASILPHVLGIVLVLVGFGFFVALHYFTWGRWLINSTARETSAADDTSEDGRSTP